jgi:hypothetical protein
MYINKFLFIVLIILIVLLIYNKFTFEKFTIYNNYEYSDKLTINNIKDLKLGQQIMTDMFREFDKICRQHNLKYWCTSGTLIGIIRHKGWIPHDGDIDVAMLETEWKKFKEVSKNILSTKYWIQDTDTDKNYKLCQKKIRHKYSCYKNGNEKYHLGLMIDIFPYERKGNLLKFKRKTEFKDLKNYDYNFIFPLKEAYFEDILVYVPNKYKEYSKLNWGSYPPKVLDKDKKFPHEGIINPNKTCKFHYKMYPNMYPN